MFKIAVAAGFIDNIGYSHICITKNKFSNFQEKRRQELNHDMDEYEYVYINEIDYKIFSNK